MNSDDSYSRRNMLNLTQQLEALLSQKQKTFFEFFFAFLKYKLNLEHFYKKDGYPTLVISKLIDRKIGGYINV